MRTQRLARATTRADIGMLVNEQPLAQAARALASKKFELLRRIMADTAVSPIAFRLACVLMWKYRNEKKGGLCCPSAETLALDLAVNEKTIRRAGKELVDAGYMKIERRGKQQSNLYWPIFSDRTQMSNHEDASDWTFEGEVIGHFEPSDRTQMSKESSLEPSVEPRDGREARPTGLRSTLDGSGSALGRASPTYRKGENIDVDDVFSIDGKRVYIGTICVEHVRADHILARDPSIEGSVRVPVAGRELDLHNVSIIPWRDADAPN